MTKTAQSAWRLVATRLGFAEGPVALPDGRLACVESVGRIVVTEGPAADADHVVTLAEVPGAPNGLALGPDGALYVANNGGLRVWENPRRYEDTGEDGVIQRVALDGSVSVMAEQLPGRRPHRPNDLCFDTDGRLYFTDSGNWEALSGPRGSEGRPLNYRGGQVFVRQPDGDVSPILDVPDFPNGIALTPDGSALLVARTLSGLITRHPLDTDGVPCGKASVFADLSPQHIGPDGIDFDSRGRLYVAGPSADAIAVLDPGGALVSVIHSPVIGMGPTNLVAEHDLLWVTFGRAGALGHLDLTTI